MYVYMHWQFPPWTKGLAMIEHGYIPRWRCESVQLPLAFDRLQATIPFTQQHFPLQFVVMCYIFASSLFVLSLAPSRATFSLTGKKIYSWCKLQSSKGFKAVEIPRCWSFFLTRSSQFQALAVAPAHCLMNYFILSLLLNRWKSNWEM